MEKKFDIFISYKRKSLAIANNLYYRLTTRGYSTFFDLEEMRRDNFNKQILEYIENAQDVFVILEEGSLDACEREDWENDWFCHEIAFALEKKKNIIPILFNGYKMPPESFFPDRLKELQLKHAPDFNISFFEDYLDRLKKKDFLLSRPNLNEKAVSVFKFYSDMNCKIFKEGKIVCSLDGMSDEPYYLPVSHKGDYRFKAVNNLSNMTKTIDMQIDAGEEKKIEIKWDIKSKPIESKSKFRSGTLLLISIVIVIALFSLFYGLFPNNKVDEKNASLYLIEDTTSFSDTIDLGLPSGTIWRSSNIGAKNKYEYGDLFEWGFVTPIERKTSSNFVMSKNIIGTSYDAASVILGEKWRLPSEENIKELVTHCKWKWQNEGGHPGFLIIGPNKNSMFLPAAGCFIGRDFKYFRQFGYYWIGESCPKEESKAKELLIGIGQMNIEYGKKNVGRSIRPVFVNGEENL